MLVERCLAMAREAPEDPYAGLAPASCFNAANCPISTATTRASPTRPSFAPARSRRRTRRLPSRRHQFERRGRQRLGNTIALATSGGFSGAYRVTGHSCSAAVIAGEGAAMQRDHAWHSARHLEDLEAAGGDRPRAPVSAQSRGSIRRVRSPADIR